ncbi:hypothetical protein NBRC10512_000531 [Rhodotorula toruloides]|uniref:Phosphopantothenoylcysteine decarboxylase n=1 Tax=Rhodotorula toruloides (strain NP11) TaxID=1130832 RepID=M7XTR5_RHOT1|nr:phosphopantothenoylcysteine decarboxylase [Rhodotorula toruloides NP11]EMS23623.1 phosphopantothenoylcysteine decarboxylase [Rhodotorula toruloides NP11]
MDATEDLRQTIARLLPNGLGAKGDEERNPVVFPARNLHVLLAVSGSVASIKAPLIVRELLKHDKVDVQVVATKSATHFFDATEIEKAYSGRVRVWTDADEWAGWNQIGDPVLHIELRRWADVVLVAPCSANTLAKITSGICDNILVRHELYPSLFTPNLTCSVAQTSFLRALPTFVPVHLFPAMNTHMYSHPLTAKQLKMVQEELGYKVHGPIGKKLACGDIGIGAMTEWSDIVQLVVNEYGLKRREEAS